MLLVSLAPKAPELSHAEEPLAPQAFSPSCQSCDRGTGLGPGIPGLTASHSLCDMGWGSASALFHKMGTPLTRGHLGALSEVSLGSSMQHVSSDEDAGYPEGLSHQKAPA